MVASTTAKSRDWSPVRNRMALSAPRRPSLIFSPLLPRKASASSMNSSSPCTDALLHHHCRQGLCCRRRRLLHSASWHTREHKGSYAAHTQARTCSPVHRRCSQDERGPDNQSLLNNQQVTRMSPHERNAGIPKHRRGPPYGSSLPNRRARGSELRPCRPEAPHRRQT